MAKIVEELKEAVPGLFHLEDHGFSRVSKLPPLVLTPKSDAKFQPGKPINASYKEQEYIKDQFAAMEQAGIVSPSTSSIVSPVYFCVPKPPNLLRMSQMLKNF
eukprot:Nk52_evm1s1885 gene=Nk52_evmTU1s1885